MAGSVNKVILVGDLGADPEVRQTQDGRPIVNLRLATSENWRDKATGERREKTEWHRVVIFNENLAKRRRAISEEGLEGLHRGPASDAQMAGPVRPGPLLDRSRSAAISRRAHHARRQSATARARATQRNGDFGRSGPFPAARAARRLLRQGARRRDPVLTADRSRPVPSLPGLTRQSVPVARIR